jgi:hypothetical protein
MSSELRPQDYQAGPEIDRLQRNAAIVGIVGAIATVAGGFADSDQFFRSYLVAFLFILGPSLGCLALMMVHNLSGGAWGLAVRRQMEAASSTMIFVAVLFVPIIFGMHHIFEWTHADVVARDPVLIHKAPYLNATAFVIRAAVYFTIWCGLAWILTRMSKAQDSKPTKPDDPRFQNISGPGLVLYAFSITFASFDWVMSLNPHWYSTLMGLHFLVGNGLAAIAFTIMIAFVLSRSAAMSSVLSAEKFHDYGKLLLAFVMLWAYLSYSQFLIIWSGNLPEETPWYIMRFQGFWGVVAIALVVGHFALPYSLLLSRDLKRRASRLSLLAAFILVMRWVDLYWHVQPQFNEGRFAFHWMDVTAVAGLFGLWLAVFCWNLKGRSLLPVGDPYLKEALADGHH